VRNYHLKKIKITYFTWSNVNVSEISKSIFEIVKVFEYQLYSICNLLEPYLDPYSRVKKFLFVKSLISDRIRMSNPVKEAL
jgi:hypothetical protein